MQITIYFRAYVSLLPGQLYLKCEHDLHQCFERIMTRQARFKTIRFCSVQRYHCINIVQEHSKYNLAIILSGIHAGSCMGFTNTGNFEAFTIHGTWW